MFANLANLIRYRGLIQSLVARELKARYRGSRSRLRLVVHQPAAAAARSTRSSSQCVLPNITQGDRSPTRCSCSAASCRGRGSRSSLTEAAGSLISGGNLIKKVLFPREVLPIVSVLANMVHFILGLPILAGVLDLLSPAGPIAGGLLWFPVAMLGPARSSRARSR